MEIIKEVEKEETAHITLNMPTVTVKRYHALVARGNRMHPRVKVASTIARQLAVVLDELEGELNAMTVKPLRPASKPEE